MENVYVDYDYYSETYGGTKITSEELFEPLAITESRYLDMPTFYRLRDEEITAELTDEDWDNIKYCLCELIEMQYDYNNQLAGSSIPKGIKSESVDGFSRTYLSPDEVFQLEKNLKTNKNILIKAKLGYTGLLFRG